MIVVMKANQFSLRALVIAFAALPPLLALLYFLVDPLCNSIIRLRTAWFIDGPASILVPVGKVVAYIAAPVLLILVGWLASRHLVRGRQAAQDHWLRGHVPTRRDSK